MSRQGASGLRPARGQSGRRSRRQVKCSLRRRGWQMPLDDPPMTIPALTIVFDAPCDAEASLFNGEPARRFRTRKRSEAAGAHGLQAPCRQLAAGGRRERRRKEQAVKASKVARASGRPCREGRCLRSGVVCCRKMETIMHRIWRQCRIHEAIMPRAESQTCRSLFGGIAGNTDRCYFSKYAAKH